MNKILSSVAILFTIIANTSFANQQSQAEANKKNVIAFYNEIINRKDFNAASKFIGKEYVQHNPKAADGTDGLKNYIQYLRDTYPQAKSDIKHIFAEGDYVVLHVHTTLQPNTRGLSIVDIFKLNHGKIVEHWDTIQEVPAQSANPNGMF